MAIPRQPTQKLRFTKPIAEALPSPPPGHRPVYYRDTEIRGLQLRVSSTGVKAWVLYRKIAGQPERLPIGHFPDLHPDQARKKAYSLNGKIADGINPADTKRETARQMTFGDRTSPALPLQVTV